jgi:hypothetical protein
MIKAQESSRDGQAKLIESSFTMPELDPTVAV